jgi:hypothetical protein
MDVHAALETMGTMMMMYDKVFGDDDGDYVIIDVKNR